MLLDSQRLLAENSQKPLRIGDKLPNIELRNFLKDPKKVISVDDLKGKAIIIDFFATYCGPCVSALSNLNELQEKYKDQIQIIVVTRETRSIVEKAMPRLKQLQDNKLPVLFSDSVLSQMFPHLSIPHEIWINSEGVVKAITKSEFVNSENIESLLKGTPLQLPEKQDFLNYDESKIFSENLSVAKVKPNAVFRSIFSSNLPGGITQGKIIRNDGFVTRSIVNSTILDLYKMIIDPKFWAGRVIVDAKDSSRFFPVNYKNRDWDTENTFCYQLTAPAATSDQVINRIMRNDFNSHLNLQIATEARVVHCWALRIVNNERFKKCLSVKNVPLGNGIVTMKNGNTIEEIVGTLNNAGNIECNAPIIINEVKSKELIDFDIPNNLLPSVFPDISINEIRKFLQSKGLDLLATKIKMEVVVIRDDNY